MTLKTRKWLEGLLQSFFSGIGSVVSVMVVDPADFNFESLDKVALVGLIAGAIHMVQFLSRTPLPEIEDTSTVSRTVINSFKKEQ